MTKLVKGMPKNARLSLAKFHLEKTKYVDSVEGAAAALSRTQPPSRCVAEGVGCKESVRTQPSAPPPLASRARVSRPRARLRRLPLPPIAPW